MGTTHHPSPVPHDPIFFDTMDFSGRIVKNKELFSPSGSSGPLLWESWIHKSKYLSILTKLFAKQYVTRFYIVLLLACGCFGVIHIE